MPDASGTDATPTITRLADYTPPDYLIDSVDLVFDLSPSATRVTSRLAMRRNPDSAHLAAPLRLDGQALELIRVAIDGEALGANRYTVASDLLVIDALPDSFTLDIETRIDPAANTELSGLYRSGGNFCTQCEAEGFRRITYFLDRPDVMARYRVTLVADPATCPVLLSNGNRIDSGETADGRHWAQWEDPHPKPAYLFALVAGDLVALEDSFMTRSGRKVALAIWVRRGDEDKCGHAMDSLKRAMRWDEEVFGLEYDLDLFNIVAVSDFNMGAMENKGLNIFNTKYVLAKPETATDGDFFGVESVIAHEYFHNWTGNRVTCRDWFQLSLKEGLTVFRDQEFSADMNSRPVERIGAIRQLRARQFPEDAGPLAHPVRPDSYIEIDNFYTATVYEKGAEIVRMIHTLLGAANFRKGLDLYFARHDNQAVTIEDFVAAMQDASGVDLGRFRLWYAQAGTPTVMVRESWDRVGGRYTLSLSQETKPTPGQSTKEPLVIPVAMGLIDADGREIPTQLDGETSASPGTRLLVLDTESRDFVFTGLESRPTPSLLRGFSAPVRLTGLDPAQLKFLARHDSDPVARWEAGQQVATRILLELVADAQAGRSMVLAPDLPALIARHLAEAEADPAFAAEASLLPGETYLADQMAVVDVDAIHAARRFARAAIGRALRTEFGALYDSLRGDDPTRIDGMAAGRRALKALSLGYLAAGGHDGAIALAAGQVESGGNMTDVLAALTVLVEHGGEACERALDHFYNTWVAEALVIDKWFVLQATSPRADTLARVRALTAHPGFALTNPNRARALIGAFSGANPVRFHAADGAGYDFLAEQILAIDPLNSSLAARLVQPLGAWRRFDAGRAAAMKAALGRILALPTLSKGAYEMASKSLA
jgi:aminopeptidase N